MTVMTKTPLPMEIVLIRHGQSEANVVQSEEKAGREHPRAAEIRQRPDWEQRLTDLGRDQARQAGEWLDAHGLAPRTFDRAYTSMMLRAFETAALVGPDVEWSPEVKVIERDWGHFGATPLHVRSEQFPHTERARKTSPLFARFDGGESMFDTVMRAHAMLGTLSRDVPDGSAFIVAHGGLLWGFRFILERMLPAQFHALDEDKSERIGNLDGLHYTRVSPDDPSVISPTFSSGWTRRLNPLNDAESGEWRRVEGRRRLTADELMAEVNRVQPIIGSN
jgi:broad specificity phosphatase PhoE